LLAFFYENALVSFSGTLGLVLVERSRLDAVRAEQNLLRQGHSCANRGNRKRGSDLCGTLPAGGFFVRSIIPLPAFFKQFNFRDRQFNGLKQIILRDSPQIFSNYNLLSKCLLPRYFQKNKIMATPIYYCVSIMRAITNLPIDKRRVVIKNALYLSGILKDVQTSRKL